MTKGQDATLIRKAGLALGALIIFVTATALTANGLFGTRGGAGESSEVLAARLAPVGRVNISTAVVVVEPGTTDADLAGANEAEAPAPTALAAPPPQTPSRPPAASVVTVPSSRPDTASVVPVTIAAEENVVGKKIYHKICFVCHDDGIAGSPKLGDRMAWESRVAKGRDVLVHNAINGFQGNLGIMPARGGIASLSDEEIAATVSYMLQALDRVVVPERAAEPVAAAAPPTPATKPAAKTVAPIPVTADGGRGKEVYDSACFVCHATGAAGAPKLGEVTAWSARIASGKTALYDHAINGFMGNSGLMPPRGGRPDFSDEDVTAAVDYMVGESD